MRTTTSRPTNLTKTDDIPEEYKKILNDFNMPLNEFSEHCAIIMGTDGVSIEEARKKVISILAPSFFGVDIGKQDRTDEKFNDLITKRFEYQKYESNRSEIDGYLGSIKNSKGIERFDSREDNLCGFFAFYGACIWFRGTKNGDYQNQINFLNHADDLFMHFLLSFKKSTNPDNKVNGQNLAKIIPEDFKYEYGKPSAINNWGIVLSEMNEIFNNIFSDIKLFVLAHAEEDRVFENDKAYIVLVPGHYIFYTDKNFINQFNDEVTLRSNILLRIKTRMRVVGLI